MSDLLQDKITNAEKRFEEAHGKGDEALTMLYCNQLVELLEIKNAFQAKQHSAPEEFTIIDIYGNLSKGEYVKGLKASLWVAPYETLVVGSGTVVALGILYSKVYVTLRHLRVPYSQTQLDVRNSFGAKLSSPRARRVYLACALGSWVLDKVRVRN